jgi:hypothetical protein
MRKITRFSVPTAPLVAVSPASVMGPPLRQCDGTASGGVSVGAAMIAEWLAVSQGRGW